MTRRIGLLLAPIVAAGLLSPATASIKCYWGGSGQELPRATLLIENRTSAAVEISVAWPTLEGRNLMQLLPARTVSPRSEGQFLYAVTIGRNMVYLRIVVDGRVFEATPSVYVNNEGPQTCNKVYRLAVTNETFPGAVFPNRVALGCTPDRRGAKSLAERDLSGLEWNNAGMTVDLCIARCSQESFKYAGLQYGTWCFCGNAYNRYQGLSQCDMPCGGNKAQTCGGVWANQIYQLR